MRIIRAAPSEHGRFVTIPNATIRDPRLTYCARGILAELLSRPADWQATADELWSEGRRDRPRSREGQGTIRAAFAELVTAGYLHRVRRQDSAGVWRTQMFLFDRPHSKDEAKADIEAHRRGGNGTSVPPAQTPIPPGRTDVGDTGMPVGATSLRRQGPKTWD